MKERLFVMAELMQNEEYDWNDEIVKDSENFEPLPEGDYNFTIEKFERSRSKGEGELPPCNMAIVYFIIHGQDHDVTIKEYFVLHKKMEWKLSQLFCSVGLKKEGEPFRMNWSALPGLTGSCKVTQTPGFKDPSKIFNTIDTLYPKKTKFTPGKF